jgi:hypothetical protein
VDPADAAAADASAAGTSTASDDSGTSTDSGAAADAQASEGGEAPPEVVPRVVEIEDHSGAGDGSDLYAKVDTDADGLADTEDRLFKTSDGTWHGDINADGYSEDVAFDHDMDGKIDSVDTTGQGSSSNVVDAERVVDPQNENIVDHHPGEDDFKVEEEKAAIDSGLGTINDDASSSFQVQDVDDPGAPAAGGDDAGDVSGGFTASDAGDTDDASAASSADDSSSSYDPGSSHDSGSSSPGSDSTDYSSTTTDSGSSSDDDGSTTT